MAPPEPEQSGRDANAAAAARPRTFEESLARLDAIVHDLEEGSLGLADALARYEEGVGLLSECQSLLERAERRIELLTGVDPEGNAVVRPFDAAEGESLETKADARSRRRSTSAAADASGAAAPTRRRRKPREDQPSEAEHEPGTGATGNVDEPEGLF